MRVPTALLAACLASCAPPAPTGQPPVANPEPAGAAAWPDLPALDDALLRVMEAHAIPGLAACLVDGAEVTWCRGYGSGSVADPFPVTSETPFLLASVSKAVVGLAVTAALEEGLFTLDDDVAAVTGLDGLRHVPSGRPMRVRDVVTHTAGIDDNWDLLEPLYTDGDPELPLGSFLADYLQPGGAAYDPWNYADDAPGEAFVYTNVGAALAAYLVEARAGVPFATWCSARLFAPLGLTNLGWYLADLDPGTAAFPTERAGGVTADVPHYGFPDYPSGQLRAGAADIARLLALVGGDGTLDGVEVLPAAAVRRLFVPPQPEVADDMGLLWYSWRLDGETLWGHQGGETGATTDMGRFDDGVGYVVLANAELGIAPQKALARALRDAARGLAGSPR